MMMLTRSETICRAPILPQLQGTKINRFRASPFPSAAVSKLHIKTGVTGTASIVSRGEGVSVSRSRPQGVRGAHWQDQTLRLMAGASSFCSPTAKLFVSAGFFTLITVSRTNRMPRPKFPRSTSAGCNQGRKGERKPPVSGILRLTKSSVTARACRTMWHLLFNVTSISDEPTVKG